MRETIDKRIRAVIPGDEGAIASALITGKRDAITTPVNDAMYVSGLAHVLSISGYHMAVVAGIVFFFVRALLALIPSLASRHPIKKWAALGALVAAAFYLLLSGAEVATQRSFIMIAIVLIGVMVDRPTLTFRTLTVAAFGVLLLAPEAVVHPSFQMSFAATLALIAGYQHGLPWRGRRRHARSARASRCGAGARSSALILASLVAGLATTPYAAFHFHRAGALRRDRQSARHAGGVGWVMPMGILGVLAMPFGFDAHVLGLMGCGIDWMIAVALWVAHLPGAVGRIRPSAPGRCCSRPPGMLLLCLLRTPLRWSGAVLGVVASLWAVTTPRPDVLVCRATGRRRRSAGATARLAVLHTAATLSRSRNGSPPTAMRARQGCELAVTALRCDAVGCIGQLADGRLVSLALSARGLRRGLRARRRGGQPARGELPCAAILVDRRASGAPTAPSRCAGPASVLRRAPPGRRVTTGPGRAAPAKTSLWPRRSRRRRRVGCDAAQEDLEAGD